MQTAKVLCGCDDLSEPRMFAIMQYVPKSHMLANMFVFDKIMISIFAFNNSHCSLFNLLHAG